jgi:hypothetical protein
MWTNTSRWMYLIERTIKVFKRYVHNKTRLKTSMVERYILDETIGFVTKYMKEFVHFK